MINKTNWVKRSSQDKENALELSKQVNLAPIVTEYLISRGYDTAEKINKFFHFKEADLRNPETLKDYRPFMDRLLSAIRNREVITIYADYDADGVMAGTIWKRTFDELNIKSHVFVNHRFKEGYGLNVKGMERLCGLYPETKLIVTCDNGVVAFEGVEYAQSKGIDVIVSDHHVASPDGRLPNCPVVCEHRIDEDETLKESMCGAEMSRRLVSGLKKELDKTSMRSISSHFIRSLYAFSGVATITDSVPLTLANRLVAIRGMQVIGMGLFPCFNFLKKKLEVDELTEETIGFTYGPVINAISRLTGDVTDDIKFFTTKDNQQIEYIGNKLISYNEKRKELMHLSNDLSEVEWKNNVQKPECAVLYQPGKYEFEGKEHSSYAEGMCGLVSSHIVELTGRPTIVFSPLEDDSTVLKGSARSVEGFNIKQALDECKDLLIGYGGHAGAAGLSIRKNDLDAFTQHMSKLVRDSHILEKENEIILDYVITPKEATSRLVVDLNRLRPFGNGFERPKIAIVGNLSKTLLMPVKAEEKKHVALTLTYSGESCKVLWWNSIERYNELMKTDPKQLILVGNIGTDIQEGRIVPKVTLVNNYITEYKKGLIQQRQVKEEVFDPAVYNE